MTRLDETFYPKVVKTIVLSEDERVALRKVFRLSETMREFLIAMVQAIAENGISAQDEAWDMVATKFGYADLTDLQGDDCALGASWRTGVVTLRGKAEKTKENDHA